MKRPLIVGSFALILVGCWDFRALDKATLLQGQSVSISSMYIPCSKSLSVETTLTVKITGFTPDEPVEMVPADKDMQCNRISLSTTTRGSGTYDVIATCPAGDFLDRYQCLLFFAGKYIKDPFMNCLS